MVDNGSVRCPVLVGRRQVVEDLNQGVTAAAAGQGQVVMVAGEPGIGKTRLVGEVSRVARVRRVVTLTGRASAEDAGSPLRPFAEALLVGTRDVPRPDSADIRPFLPMLGLLLPHWRSDGWTAPTESPLIIAEAVLRLLRLLAGTGGLLLVLEDLHWADEVTLGVVDYLVDHCAEMPVMACLTTRPDEGCGPALLADLLRRSVPVHRLGRLARHEVDEMISACAGGDARRYSSIADAADGLPLLVEDLLSEGGDQLPSRFADSVRARSRRLNSGALRSLRLAALLGDVVDWSPVCRVAGPDSAGALEAALAVDLLVMESGSVRFRHALTRDVILADLDRHERVRLAAAAGMALLADPPNPARDLRAAALLDEGEQPARALSVLRQSGESAASKSELGHAEAALRAAFELARMHEPASAPELGYRLAQVLVQAGRPREVVDLGSALLSLVEGRDSEVEASVHVLVARAHIGRGAWADARSQLRHARSVGTAGPRIDAEIAVLETECALGEDREGQRAAVEHLAVRAVAMARSAAQPDLEAEGLEQVGRVARMRDLDAASASLRSALTLAGEHDLHYRRLQVLNELGAVEMLRDATPDRLIRARAEAIRCGAFGLGTSAGLNLASAYVMTGRNADAIALAREVAETARRLDQGPILAGCELMEGIAYAFNGDQPSAERHLARAEQLAPDDTDLRAGAWGIGRGIGALVAEDRDGARRAFARAAREAPRHVRILDAAQGPSLLLAAIAGQTSAELIQSVITEQVHGARWHELWLGAALAVALASEHQLQPASTALQAALAAGERYPLFAALVRRLAVEAAIQTGFTDPISLLRDAEAAFDALTLPRPAAAIRGMLRSLGAAAPRRRRGDAQADPHLQRFGVTAREAEVLELLADRLTNRQIAQQLYLSPKTVEKHVAALTRKLGVRDRIELAELARTRRR